MLELWERGSLKEGLPGAHEVPSEKPYVKLDETTSSGQGVVKDVRPQQVILLQRGGSLTVTGQIEGHPVRFLVDTGATITLVSTRVYSKLSGSPLQPVDFTVYQADGEPMSTKGHMTCKISLGPLQVLQDVVVADLQEDAILGMDFLLSHDCKLDLVELKMQIQDISVTLWNIHDIGSFCKVTIAEDGHVPGKHEAIIAGRP